MAGEYGLFEFQDEALLPRYYIGDPRPTLHRRQDNKCDEDHHQCVDIGFPGTCCANDRYCYVDPDAKTARCCPLERNCDEECGSTRYFCEQTATITPTGDDQATTTVTPACCARVCTEQSFYRCEEDQGGQCCPYDNACSGTVCVSTVSSTLPPLVTPVDEGCTTSQSRCDDGDGCCDVTRKCTQLSGTAVCAPADFTAPGEVVDASDDLSDGAKAGIGVGVAVGASLITAGLTFLYLRRRGKKRARSQDASPAEGDEEGGVELTVTMSPEPHGAGLAQDYFGPDARDGPLSGAGTTSPVSRATAVPAQPVAPDDIVVPVEIDSSGVTPVGEEEGGQRAKEGKGREPGPYELQGSDVPELASPELPSGDPGKNTEPVEVESPVFGRDTKDKGKAADVESPMLGEGSGNKGKGVDVESPVLGQDSTATDRTAEGKSPILGEGSGNKDEADDEVSPTPGEDSKGKDKTPADGESPILPPSEEGPKR